MDRELVPRHSLVSLSSGSYDRLHTDYETKNGLSFLSTSRVTGSCQQTRHFYGEEIVFLGRTFQFPAMRGTRDMHSPAVDDASRALLGPPIKHE